MAQQTSLEAQQGTGPIPGKPGSSPENPSPSPGKPSTDPELARDRYGVWLVVAAFALLGIVFGIAIFHFKTASDVAAVVGSVGTVVGTIVGAFFGVHAGASGRQTAEAGRQAAEAGRRTAKPAARKRKATARKRKGSPRRLWRSWIPQTAESLIKDL